MRMSYHGLVGECLSITQFSQIDDMIFTYHTRCIVNRNSPGTTKSSDPTDHRRLKIITPGIFPQLCDKWRNENLNNISWRMDGKAVSNKNLG